MSEPQISNSGVYATFHLANRGKISALRTVLGDENPVSVVALYDPEASETDSIMIDLNSITDKQWEALHYAAKLGHYSGAKRSGNLSRIANELDISKSAVSQRLRAAEAAIMSQIVAIRDYETELDLDDDEPTV